MLNACSINKVILMGRLTSDPELRQAPSGSSTCNFTVAINRGANPTTNEQQTDFIRVVAWDKNAEFASRYLRKGRLVLVEGNLKTGSYDDRNHPDVKHYTCDVFAERLSFGETKSASQDGGMNYAPQQFAQPQYSQPAPAQAAPAAQQAQQEPAPAVAFGDFNDFEGIIGDGDLPF